MFHFLLNSTYTRKAGGGVLLAALLGLPVTGRRAKKKKAEPTAAPEVGPRKFSFDPSKLVWPSPPNIARVHWVDYFAGAKIEYAKATDTKPKASWMDRL